MPSTIQTAASSVEERELIAAIAGDLRDLSARDAYLRWLKARDDRRFGMASQITELARRLFYGDDDIGPCYLQCTGYARAWLEILGCSILHSFIQTPQLCKVKELIAQLAKPTLEIIPEAVGIDNLPIDGSRFGGRAALPADLPWPDCSEGPLQFLGQIALAEIQFSQAARQLPKTGWLSFFALNENIGGNGINDDVRVIYFPADCKLQWRTTPAEVDRTSWTSACQLTFIESVDLPDEHDQIVSQSDQARLDQSNTADEYDNLRHSLQFADCRLFGYGRHSRTSDPAPGVEWQNLICLGSINSLAWNWCDGEHLAMLVQGDDLAEHRFERVFGYAS